MCLNRYKVLDRGTRAKNGKLYNEDVLVPCGQCQDCRQRSFREWAFRLKQEYKRHDIAYFVTLTYNTDNVPISEKGFMTLRKKHLQNYFKRLRKLSQGNKIKYYGVGEYGSQRKRPHYHIILFGANKYDIIKAWFLDGKELGEVHIGNVQDASIAYTLKYVNKQAENVPSWKDIEQPFKISSQGLGDNYLSPNIINYHKQDIERNYVQDGQYKVSMPKYYRDKIYTEKEKSFQAHRSQEKAIEADKKLETMLGGKDILVYKAEARRSKTEKKDDYSQRKF